MKTSPEFDSKIELGPKIPKKDSIVEIFLRDGKTEEFESSLSFYIDRLEKLADEHKEPLEAAIARLELDMFKTEIYLKIGDIDSAAESLEAVWLRAINDPNLKDDGTPEKIDLYEDIWYLDDQVNKEWEARNIKSQ